MQSDVNGRRRSMPVRMLVLIVFILGFMTGCEMAMVATKILPAPKHTGSFTLGGETPTVRVLLVRLRDRAPATMKAQGLGEAAFDADEGRQWATVSFKEPAWIHWVLGVQFVRSPDEIGPAVEAYVRSVSEKNGNVPDPDRLKDVLPKLRSALETAAAAKGS
jgi:hypothetical protein